MVRLSPGMSPLPVSDALPPAAEAIVPAEQKRRRLYITPPLIERYGYTPGCPGCEKVLAGAPGAVGKTHSERRRARIRKAIDEEDAKGKRKEETKE